MDAATANSLVTYINSHSTRFSASTIHFPERTWVILCDSKAPHTAPCEEPILDIDAFLERLDRRTPLNSELRNLLQLWLKSVQDDKAGDWPAAPAVSRRRSLSASRDAGMRPL
jgi:hypothetical protein